MIKSLIPFLLIVSSPAYAQSNATKAPADEQNEEAIMTPINALLDGLSSGDIEAMRPHIQDGATMTISDTRVSETLRIPFEQWLQQVAGAKDSLEEIMPNPTIKVDGKIAMVWGYYTLKRNGELSHCGINHFSLANDNGKWKIANLAFSVRRINCKDHSK